MPTRNVILMFGLVNACLFSALLPLWEGFDEAFHYGYVETLWQTRHLPVLGRTVVPNDVFRSFQFAPVGPVVHRWFPETTTFDAWFSLPQAEKDSRREQLDLLRPEPKNSSRPNYEAHHPPLAYVVLAPLDWILSGAPITTRVLILRLFAASVSTLLLYFGGTALCQILQMPERFTNAALFTIFCSEMLYATISHVSNDWLAVAIGAQFLAAIAGFFSKLERRTAWRAGLWLAAGLLTKAYFLVFALLAVAAVAVLIRRKRMPAKTALAEATMVIALAGPWYARNVLLYGHLSGTYEEFAGIGFSQTIAAAGRIDWVATAGFLSRSSLWTGNSSFTSFSISTLDVILLLLFAAVAAWILHIRLAQPSEGIIFAAICMFSVAIAYASCASFARTNGQVAGASPWYAQILVVPVMALAYLGLSRSGRFGSVVACSMVTMGTWVLIATWTVKLFPMYSGGGTAPMRIREVWNWYALGAPVHMHDLSTLALSPAPLLYAGMLASVILSISLSAFLIRQLMFPRLA